MEETDIDSLNGHMRKSVLSALIAIVVVATLVTFFGAHRYFGQLETMAASNRMELYLRSLNETLRQHQHMPFVLAGDPRYSSALDPGAVEPETNVRLSQLAKQAKLEAIYLMDASGVVLAASNAGLPNSFLGQNYGFRPYFKEALVGQRSDYFAIGATSGRPGYFVAEPVAFTSGSQQGVIAIKLDVSELQRSWESGAETVVAINKDNIIVLSSNPDWLYRPIIDLTPDVRQTILQSRQFGNEPLPHLDWVESGDTMIAIERATYIAARGQSDWRDWSVVYLHPESKITRQTLVATVLFGSLIALLVGFATFLRSRRIALAYAASERRRLALTQTNRQLEQAQAELARSAKLSALGQLAASVTHELGQPISAFRNHLAAAEIGGEITSPSTAKSLNKLVERMEAITRQFRYFARGKTADKVRVDFADILGEVGNLLHADFETAGVTLRVTPLVSPTEVQANKVMLEQALTNLLTNALHAVENEPSPEVSVGVTSANNRIEVRISDNGPGLDGVNLADLQEPFFSTKPSGIGMGLGLAIATEIIKDHGGELTLEPSAKGAEFVFSLPVLPSGEAK
ncbi:sensor histidine kinase [Phaeobacter inhibens]|uniref:sensor histidine kinase n=1 Tax=Phaeobacter inhibens TaxID=221822 RepID=UPI000CA34C82|nr:ATP-binding protein [Phaeobacter inhibens]AUR06385.1 C4-dicarboxylate transport sensor protein DctB [Phaeobacter inhibens]